MIDIRNCKLAYRCNQQWHDLEAVPGALRLRFCSRCQTAVHRADNEAEFAALAAQGRCVAVFSDGGDACGVGRAERLAYGMDAGNGN
ncbi:MAG: hypothetical protein JSR27_10030 [Proteobacteria bacterium]|nr:hypothetical protein [Pseudomonadota bacterium]